MDRLAAGGDGVARLADRRVVFVPFTAPGDRVRVRIVEERARYVRAEVVTLLEPGPGRTDPLCAVFGTCGGCAWQHLAYPTQLAAKQEILRDALERIARLRVPEPPAIHPSPEPYGYRSRARVFARQGRVGFRRRRSHVVCATARCPVLVPELDVALAALADEPRRSEAEWELSAGSDGDLSVSPASAAWPPRAVTIRCGEDRLRISPGVFVQGNALLRERLAQAVHGAAGRGERALELYAGAGLFSLGLARRFRQLTAVEAEPAAVADLEANLAAAGAEGVRVVGAGVEEFLADPGPAPEAVILDPPRAGLGAELADSLARLAAARVVYVSCDPATLARDLGVLADRGYELASLEAFDLFPQTPHVEALATLVRG